MDSVPQEFVYLPADYQVFYEQPFENHTSIWKQVVPFFSQCTGKITQQCTVDNGEGAFICVQGNVT